MTHRVIRQAPLVYLASAFAFASIATTTASADRIHLRTGETIKGKLIPDLTVKDRLLLYGSSGRTPMTLQKSQVSSVTPEPSVLDEYATRREHPLSTGAAEFEMAEWCASNGLKDLATAHYEAAVKKDPDLDEAHKALGHVEHEGKWLTTDQARKASGLVLHKGRWITSEEFEQKKGEESASAEQVSWQKRLNLLLRSYRAGPQNRQLDVQAQLLAIRETVAVGPLQRTFGSAEEPEIRILGARALGAIPSTEAAGGLVGRLLAESDQDVREAILVELAKREEPVVISRLLAALKSKAPETINRAAWALGELHAVETVPKLIASLVTTETKVVWVTPGNTPSLPTETNVAPTGEVSIGRSYPVMTGPVMAPGAVAFGATSVPYSEAFSSMGVNVGGLSRGPVPKMENFSRRNTEVLSSLRKLTDQDFGYDVNAWRQWVRRAYQPDPAPVRRVPEP